MICDLCLAMGGRFNANRACCRARLAAGMPLVPLLAVFARVRAEEGAQAEATFREQVRIEVKRQREHRREKARAALQHVKAALV